MGVQLVPLAFIQTWYDAVVTTTSGKGGRPMVTEGVFAPAHVLVEAIRRREVSSVEVVEAYLAQIARHNPDLKAVVTLDEDGARIRAREADAALARGEEWGPLHGCRSPWRMPTLPRGCVRPGAGCHVWQTTSRRRMDGRGQAQGGRGYPPGQDQRAGDLARTRSSPEPTTPGIRLRRRLERRRRRRDPRA